MNKDLILRAHKVVKWFAKSKRDAKSAAMVYMPDKYRSMMRVFRNACYTFTAEDLSSWEELIKILKTQDRCKQKSAP